MKQLKPEMKPNLTPDRWKGIFAVLVLLIVVVVIVVVAVAVLPVQNLVVLSSPTPLFASSTQTVGMVVETPPIVDTTRLVSFAGVLVLLILGVVLRELLWVRRKD